MTIQLRPELEQLIQKDIQRGGYESVEQFVERAIQLLHDEERWLQEKKAAIHQAIGEGLAQLDLGEGVPGEVSHARLQEKRLRAGIEVANRVEAEIYRAFDTLAQNPRLGHRRSDLTSHPVLFFTVYSYMIVYYPRSPIEIARVLHANGI